MNRHLREAVLINPCNPSATGTNRATTEPPLGLAYLGAVLRERGCDCRIVDAEISRMSAAETVAAIGFAAPSLVGLSCNILNYPGCRALAGAVRTAFPSALLVAGGPFASSQPERCLAELGADAVAIGEGEETVREIADAFTGDRGSLEGVRGLLVARAGAGPLRTPPRPLAADLDRLPFPARDLFPPGHPYGSRLRGTPADAVLTSRGCPHKCTYCNKEIYGNRFRARSPGNVMEEIDLLVSRGGVRQLDILDENFTLDIQRAEAILDAIIARPYRIFINMMNGIRADRLTAGLVTKMRRAGVFCVSVGVESGDQGIVDRCRKSLDLGRVLESTRWLRDAGIVVYGNFILGLPGDTPATMQRTIDFAVRMNPHIANFQIACPFPGTELYDEVAREGRFIIPTEHGVDFGFYSGKAFFEIGETRASDVEEYFRKAYRRFYFRPSKMADLALSLRTPSEVAWVMRAAADKVLTVLGGRTS